MVVKETVIVGAQFEISVGEVTVGDEIVKYDVGVDEKAVLGREMDEDDGVEEAVPENEMKGVDVGVDKRVDESVEERVDV